MKEIFTALSKAQHEIKGAQKDGQNPHFRSAYSTLESVFEAIKDPFFKHGLFVSQTIEGVNNTWVVKTILGHTSGESITSQCPILTEKPGMQSFGSGVSYARRYSLMAIAGVPSLDDDAEGTIDRSPINKPQPKVNTEPHYQKEAVSQAKISAPQLKRLYAIMNLSNWTDTSLQALLDEHYKKVTPENITRTDYNFICEFVQKNPIKNYDENFDKTGDEKL